MAAWLPHADFSGRGYCFTPHDVHGIAFILAQFRVWFANANGD
jgi:hypothetical protein